MKKLLLATILLTSTPSYACNFLEALDDDQREIASVAFSLGKPHDLGLTAVAVAWEESRLGKYLVRYNRKNIKDVSVGVLHTVAYWKTSEMSPFSAGRWFQKMTEDPYFSISVGVQDLLYWQGVAKGSWLKGVGMYNGGFTPNMGYAESVRDTVKLLKKCEWENIE